MTIYRATVLDTPADPFTGGALLGDRVRMQTHATDGGVFIRSMASRGHLGGLAAALETPVAAAPVAEEAPAPAKKKAAPKKKAAADSEAGEA